MKETIDSQLVGKKFKRNKYGLSDWTQTIHKVWIVWEAFPSDPNKTGWDSIRNSHYKPKIKVNGGGSGDYTYDLEEIVIL